MRLAVLLVPFVGCTTALPGTPPAPAEPPRCDRSQTHSLSIGETVPLPYGYGAGVYDVKPSNVVDVVVPPDVCAFVVTGRRRCTLASLFASTRSPSAPSQDAPHDSLPRGTHGARAL
jgi:hypothetical protein